MAQDILIGGFAFSGFRSFGGEALERVGPMSKVHLLAGLNNAGKSNALMVAQRALPALRSNSTFELTEVDAPLKPNGTPGRGFRLAVTCEVTDGDLEPVVTGKGGVAPSTLRSVLVG